MIKVNQTSKTLDEGIKNLMPLKKTTKDAHSNDKKNRNSKEQVDECTTKQN